MSAKNDAPRCRRKSEHLPRAFAQTAGIGLFRVGIVRRHPVGFFAHKERDGSHAGGNHAPLARGGILQRGGMRRQPSPADGAGQAELIEPGGIVIRDAPRQNLALPGIGGNFKSLQLAQNLERGALALHLSARRHMLPAQQPAHELRGSDRLNLFAQRGHRQAMNSRQQPPLAPLGRLCGDGRPRPSSRPRLDSLRLTREVSPQNRSAGLHAQQRLLNLRGWQSQQRPKLLRRDRTEMRHPTRDQGEKSVVA